MLNSIRCNSSPEITTTKNTSLCLIYSTGIQKEYDINTNCTNNDNHFSNNQDALLLTKICNKQVSSTSFIVINYNNT